MKILALYLPQFHEIEENNMWWGDGYTEWTAVKKAKSYYTGHFQPKIPLDNNYYDLGDKSGKVWEWQASIANKYGVYGFCIYHYWFGNNKMLLEKPMEILLSHSEININYCICWANQTWKRTWYGLNDEILIEQTYGNEEEWIKHFNYLLKFFRDKRYIKVDNKPLIHIYRSIDIPDLKAMRMVWDRLAKKNGFDGVYLVVANNSEKRYENRVECIDGYYNYEPSHIRNHLMPKIDKIDFKCKVFIKRMLNRCLKKKMLVHRDKANKLYPYTIKNGFQNGKKCYFGTFCSYDDTPRRLHEGYVIESSPNDFYNNLINIKNELKRLNREDDFVYVTAWNEWGEGAYLEPDYNLKYGYLEAISRATERC